MTTSTKTFEILGHEFELDQLNDIATHGMAQGVGGFIYSSELHDIFEANEDSILNYLDEHAFNMGERSGVQMVINALTNAVYEDVFYSMQDIKEAAVWMFVELMSVQILQRNGHPDWT